MYSAQITALTPDIQRYALLSNGQLLCWRQVLELWQQSKDFRSFYIDLLAESDYSAYRWETPSLTTSTWQQPFEFVLISTPSFDRRATEWTTFEQHFTRDEEDEGVVSFPNLGKDALLIVPSPRSQEDVYGHLAAFLGALRYRSGMHFGRW